jgi:hypothetical protein
LRFFYQFAAVDDEPVPSHLKTDVDQQSGGQNIEGVDIECQEIYSSSENARENAC